MAVTMGFRAIIVHIFGVYVRVKGFGFNLCRVQGFGFRVHWVAVEELILRY